MKFSIEQQTRASHFAVLFNETDSSVGVSPKPEGGITSVVVNYLQLEIDQEGTVLYAWGVFNHPSTWLETTAYPKNPNKGTLIANLPKPITPGISRCLNEGAVWPAYVNRQQGWICLGEPSTSAASRLVEFAPTSVAVLEHSRLVAIWLRPAQLSK